MQKITSTIKTNKAKVIFLQNANVQCRCHIAYRRAVHLLNRWNGTVSEFSISAVKCERNL